MLPAPREELATPVKARTAPQRCGGGVELLSREISTRILNRNKAGARERWVTTVVAAQERMHP